MKTMKTIKEIAIKNHLSLLLSRILLNRGIDTSEKVKKFLYPELKDLYNADIRLLTFNRIDISATDIRERIKSGKSVRYMLPDKCIEYICIKGLYK